MNRIVHFEIHTSDTRQAIAFYQNVFGWTFNQFPGGEQEYHLVITGEGDAGINGGLMPSRDGQPRVVNTAQVADVDQACQKITANGGQIVVDKFPIPGVGYVAYATDPGGVLFGIMHEDTSAAAR